MNNSLTCVEEDMVADVDTFCMRSAYCAVLAHSGPDTMYCKAILMQRLH